MSSPVVLDALGNRIEVGAKVESSYSDVRAGTVDAIEQDGSVWVTWNQRRQLRSCFESYRRIALRHTYRCPDLELITTTTKEESDGD